MPGPLQFVETIEDIRESLQNFNAEAGTNPELTRSLLSQASYWVWDPISESFGPSKFVGLKRMNMRDYEAARRGGDLGEPFGGTRTQQNIARIIGESFSLNEKLSRVLEKWGRPLVSDGPNGAVGILKGLDRDKWKFITLPRLGAAAVGTGSRGQASYWVARAAPGNFERWVKRNRIHRWWTKKPPQTWKVRDRFFIWASSPQQQIVALAELRSLSVKPHRDGYFYYKLRFLTDILSSPIKRSALEQNPILIDSILLKQGPAHSIIRLTEGEGAELYRLVGFQNPIRRIWPELSIESEDDRQEDAIKGRTDIGATTKEQLINARRGQGTFRANVKLNENQCRVTGVTAAEHLRASHIKPWSESTDEEKLNGCNGLLLAPHIDHLFDQGFISFADNGDLLVSQNLNRSVLTAWGIKLPMNVGRFKPKQAVFLALHRSKHHMK